MSGIYGETLLAFPEQFRFIEVFQMEAEVNAGWSIDEDSRKRIRCLYQHTGGKRLKETGGNLTEGSSNELWTKEPNLNGWFTRLSGDVYRINADNNWNHEGGFSHYTLEKIIGNDGTESEHPTWNIGGHNFG